MPEPASSPALSADTTIAIASDPELALFTASLVKGEEAAWADFHDRYRLRLLGYLSRTWHGEPACLDDLLQETLVRAVRHMRIFRDDETLWSWLTVLARSAVADRGRKRSRWSRFLQRWRLEAELRALPPTPHDFSRHLEAALANLDADTRSLIERKYYRRESVRTLARDLNLTEKAVEHRLARARHSLAKLLLKSSHESRS